MSALDVLLLAADKCLRDLMIRLLSGHQTTVCESPDEARQRLAEERYDLVVITNFAVSPHAGVAVIPPRRQYPVLFFTGYMDDGLERDCRERDIPWVKVLC